MSGFIAVTHGLILSAFQVLPHNAGMTRLKRTSSPMSMSGHAIKTGPEPAGIPPPRQVMCTTLRWR